MNKRKVNVNFSNEISKDISDNSCLEETQLVKDRSSILANKLDFNKSPISPAISSTHSNTESATVRFAERKSSLVPDPWPSEVVDSNKKREVDIPLNVEEIENVVQSEAENQILKINLDLQNDEPRYSENRNSKSGAKSTDSGLENSRRSLRSLLEKVARHNDQLKGLNRFFARNRLITALQSRIKKDAPLNFTQINLIGDLSNPNKAVGSADHYYYGERTRVRSSTSKLKDLKKSASRVQVRDNGLFTRAKLLASVKLVRDGKLKRSRLYKWCYFLKEWMTLLFIIITRPIRPESKFKITWDLFVLVFILWEMITIPLAISFPASQATTVWNIQIISNVFFILDILLSFQTGYFSKGSLVMARKSIALRYLRKEFIADVIGSFPYILAIPHMKYDGDPLTDTDLFLRLLLLLRLTKTFKMSRVFSGFEGYLELLLSFNTIVSLLKLSVLILIIAHWIACAWHFVAIMEQEEITWLIQAGIGNAPSRTKYVYSFYWAVTTMITVGYGDITPISITERILGIVVMIVASGVFAFTMNSINVLLVQMNQQKAYYQDIMIALSSFMKQKHVSRELRGKLKSYLAYTLKYYNSVRNKEEAIMGLLSDQLKNELVIEVNGKVLKASKHLQGLFSDKLMMRLTLIMTRTISSPNEIIFREDTRDDCSIYFIDNGSVQLFNLCTETFYRLISDRGQTFGEIAFFTGQKRTASARSGDFSGLFSIKRDDFIALLEDFYKDRQRYCMIRDQILLNANYSGLKIECFSCKSIKHTVEKCPELHYGVQKQKIIESYLSQERSFRKNFQRASRRKFDLKLIQDCVAAYTKKNPSTIGLDFIEHDEESVVENERGTQAFRGVSISRKSQGFQEDYAQQFAIESRRQKAKESPNQDQERLQLNFVGSNQEIDCNSNDNPTDDQIRHFQIYFPQHNFGAITKNEKWKRVEFKRKVTGWAPRPKKRSAKLSFMDRIRNKIGTFIGSKNEMNKNTISVHETSNRMSHDADESQIQTTPTWVNPRISSSRKGTSHKNETIFLRKDVQDRKVTAILDVNHKVRSFNVVSSPQFRVNIPEAGFRLESTGNLRMKAHEASFGQDAKFQGSSALRSVEDISDAGAKEAVDFLVNKFGVDAITKLINSQNEINDLLE